MSQWEHMLWYHAGLNLTSGMARGWVTSLLLSSVLQDNGNRKVHYVT